MKFLTNIDLVKNQILNAAAQNLGANPSAAVTGQFYFNTVENKLKIYDGAKWVNVGSIIFDETAGDGKISVDGTEMTVYSHPIEGPNSGAEKGLYKISVNELGHVTSIDAVSKADITGLDIPAQDTKVSNLTNSSSAVVTGLEGNTTLKTTAVKDLVIRGIVPIEGGYISDGSTIADALSALDTAVKNAVAGGGEVNQNAFSNIKVGATTLAAASKTATIEFVAGSGLVLTPDATSGKLTFAVAANTFADKEHTHKASDVTEGTFNAARIPNLTLSKITDAGTAASKNAATDAIADGSSDAGLVSAAQVAKYVADKTAGLTGAMHYIGTSSTALTDGGTQDPTIAGFTGNAKVAGNVVLYGNQEFIWNGTAWELLGDEGSYALKTTKINGHALSGDITLTAGDVGADATGSAAAVQTNLDTHTGNDDIHVTASQKQTWNAKQNAISDLETIRSGASRGATSVQSVSGTLVRGQTTVDVAFTGTFVGASVHDALTGEFVGTEVQVGSNKVTVTIASAYSNDLTIIVQYK